MQPQYNPYAQPQYPQPGAPGVNMAPAYGTGTPAPQYAPPMPSAPAPAGVVFVSPAAGGGELGPSPAELAGRTLAFIVTREGPGKAFAGDKRADADGNVPTVWFDLYVVDGGPLIFGAAPNATPPRPFPTHQIQTPCVFKGQAWNRTNLYRALAPFAGKGVYVLGYIERSDVGQKPWNLIEIKPEDPRFAAAQQAVLSLVTPGAAIPQAQPLNPAAMMPQGQPQYAPPAAPQHVDPQYAAWLASQQQAAPAPVPPVGPQAPTGFPAEFWATLTPAQQQAVLAQQAPAQAPAAPPNPL